MRFAHMFVLGLGMVAAVTAAEAQPMSMPGRRAGLWEMTMAEAGMEGRGMKVRQCVNPATERGFSPFDGPARRGAEDASHCSKREVHPVPAGWAFESICTRAGRTVDTSGTVTGNFQTHYRMDVVSKGDGPAHHMVMENTWIGPCPAGGEGNSIVLPGGQIVNIPSRH